MIRALRRVIQRGRAALERRLTPTGWLMALGLFASTAIGFPITEQSVAYKASTLLGVLLGGSALWCLFQRDALRLRRALPRYGTVGEILRYRVRVDNELDAAREGLVWRETVVALGDGGALAGTGLARRLKQRRTREWGRPGFEAPPARLAEQALPSLPPRGFAEATVPLLPLRRGVLRFTDAWVARPDPLGLCRSLTRARLPQSIVILPRRYPLPPLALPGTPRLQAGGLAQASSVGESEEFMGLRDYRRGDSPRRIHWKSWARAGKPVVKECQDEHFVRHALILDTFEPRLPDERAFEEAVSIAASFACTVPAQESLLDLLFVETEPVVVTIGRAIAHPEQMLEVLAAAGPARGRGFLSLQELVLSHIRLVCGCVAVLLDWDEPRRVLVRRLTRAGVPVLVCVVSREAGPGAGPDTLEGLAPDRFHWIHPERAREGLARL